MSRIVRRLSTAKPELPPPEKLVLCWALLRTNTAPHHVQFVSDVMYIASGSLHLLPPRSLSQLVWCVDKFMGVQAALPPARAQALPRLDRLFQKVVRHLLQAHDEGLTQQEISQILSSMVRHEAMFGPEYAAFAKAFVSTFPQPPAIKALSISAMALASAADSGLVRVLFLPCVPCCGVVTCFCHRLCRLT